jgi:hypothetical protein
MLASFLEGLNATVVAYGQTASGKTYSLLNFVPEVPDLDGLVPKTVRTLFDRIQEKRDASLDFQWTVSCSFLQIYNEVYGMESLFLFDILSSHPYFLLMCLTIGTFVQDI